MFPLVSWVVTSLLCVKLQYHFLTLRRKRNATEWTNEGWLNLRLQLYSWHSASASASTVYSWTLVECGSEVPLCIWLCLVCSSYCVVIPPVTCKIRGRMKRSCCPQIQSIPFTTYTEQSNLFVVNGFRWILNCNNLFLFFVNREYTHNTLGPADNEFSYNEHPPTVSRFLCIKIIDSSVWKFDYYKHPPTRSSFLCIYLLVLSGTQCNMLVGAVFAVTELVLAESGVIE